MGKCWQILLLIALKSVFVLQNLEAEEGDRASLANFEGIPSAMVNGCVNAITGDYCDFHTDVVLPGISQLTFERAYISSDTHKGTWCDGWYMNHISNAVLVEYAGDKTAEVNEPLGSRLTYKLIPDHAKTKRYRLPTALIQGGLTNCGRGQIGGATNPKNNSLKYKPATKVVTVSTGANERYRYYRQNKKSDTYDDVYDLGLIEYANGHRWRYEYDKKDHLQKICVENNEGTEIGFIKCQIFDKDSSSKQRIVKIHPSNGNSVQFTFSYMPKYNGESKFLTRVLSDGAPEVNYEYNRIIGRDKIKTRKVSKKKLPEGRFTEIEYYHPKINILGPNRVHMNSEFDSRIERVSLLKAPVGCNEEAIITHRFFYKLNQKSTGCTEIHDVYNNKTEYHYTKNKLTGVQRFGANHAVPYTSEQYYWGLENTADVGNLLSRTFSENGQPPVICRSYVYDESGNILEDRLYGNLTGKNSVPIALNEIGVPVENGAEAYVKRFQYDRFNRNLLMREDDTRKYVTYQYKSGTNLLAAKFTWEGYGVKIRNFYERDENGAVIREIIDDGCFLDSSDLTDVTERHIIVTEARKKHPVGLPDSIEHRYLDMASGQEKMLMRYEYSYTHQGKVSEERFYDANGSFVGMIQYQYNQMGLVTKIVNPLGDVTTRSYDANGNMIYEQGPRPEVHKEYFYDYSNRLIREEEVYCDGLRLAKRYGYNYLSQKTSETDIYGNETLFFYDAFGRLERKLLPSMPQENGAFIQPENRQLYNCLDQPIAKIDGRGHVTAMNLTARGEPYKVSYPDGTEEHLHYNIDGTLREKIDKNGLKTIIEYDFLERPTQKHVYSSEGELLYTTLSEYNAFHLLKEVDAAGNVTRHEYDGAGRKIRTVRVDKETRYAYDALGRLCKTIEMASESECVVACKEYDLLGRVVEERIEDGLGNIQKRLCCSYDSDGNKIRIVTFGHAGASIEYDQYNAQGERIKHIDPEGRTTVTQYRYDYVNEHGHPVGYRETTDPMGNLHIIIKDTHGRDALFERRNSLGKTTQKYRLYFDGDGNKTVRVESVMNAGEVEREIITRWEYDSANKIVKSTEGWGTKEQQETVLSYNSAGEKAYVTKADGTVVAYEHDLLGRLIRYSSSRGDIDYRYTYDQLNNPVRVDDMVCGRSTIRSYDANGNVLSEVLGNGLEIKYEYDRMGRKKRVVIPDGSSIEYEYEGQNIKRILRKGSDDAFAYCHEYLKFDQSSKIVEARLIGEAGTVCYDYDLLGRIRNIQSSSWRESLASFDAAGNLISRKIEDVVGLSDDGYTYDDLYQLSDEKGSFSHDYSYDSVNNRISKDGSSYSLNALNQVLSNGSEVFRYDLNGNLVSREGSSEKWEYRYDSLGRLTVAESERLRVEFAYDENNRRLSKQVYELSVGGDEELVSSVSYLYEGKHEIGTVSSGGAIQHLRILGKGQGAEIGAAIAVEVEGKVFAPIHDHNGNVATLLDTATGEVVEAYRYSAFGEEKIYGGEGQELVDSLNPWRFSSKRSDPELGYVYFGQRYYDPALGRWVTPDPIGHGDGPNLYAYVRNSPLTNLDLWGEATEHFRSGLELTDREVWRRERARSRQNDRYQTTSQGMKYDRNFEKRCGGFPSVKFIYEGTDVKPLPPDKRICFGNGMCNTFSQALESVAYISKLAGDYVCHAVWNATHGFFNDLIECFIGLRNDVLTKPAMLLQDNWNDYFEKAPKDGLFFQGCHSQGAIHVRNALKNYPEELRKRIIVVAIAPGAYIDKDLCHSVYHYVSDRDFVPLFDRAGRERCKDTIHVLKAHPDAKLWDHDFLSPTYRPYIEEHLLDYVNNRY